MIEILKEGKFFTLKEIEGPISTHDTYLKKEVATRAKAFEYINNPSEAALYVGGEFIKDKNLKYDWGIKKNFFPGVEIYIFYNKKDEEFPASLQILFSGENVKNLKGEDLAILAIATINHIIRYIKISNSGKKLPEICGIV
jgi:hypothetical protein